MLELEVFKVLHNYILGLRNMKSKPIRIAINGIEGTGKTVFAEKLTTYLNSRKTIAIHISIDGFHHDRKKRYRQGRNSAKAYYEDSYDEQAFLENVLISSQSHNPQVTLATHDLDTDRYVNLEPVQIEDDTIIISDGSYLFKPCYVDHWDLKIYLKTSFSVALQRGIHRDMNTLGGHQQTKYKYLNRYHKASRIGRFYN